MLAAGARAIATLVTPARPAKDGRPARDARENKVPVRVKAVDTEKQTAEVWLGPTVVTVKLAQLELQDAARPERPRKEGVKREHKPLRLLRRTEEEQAAIDKLRAEKLARIKARREQRKEQEAQGAASEKTKGKDDDSPNPGPGGAAPATRGGRGGGGA